MPEDQILIRSFRVVFDLERRIHRVDRFRIPLPYGLPLRSIGYAGAALLTVLLMRASPAGSALNGVPAPIAFVLFPMAAAYALTQLRLDGRPVHAGGAAWLVFVLSPKLVAAGRAISRDAQALGDLTVVADERCARYRRARIIGPGVVLLRYPAATRQRGSTLCVTPAGAEPMWCGKRVLIAPGQRVVLR